MKASLDPGLPEPPPAKEPPAQRTAVSLRQVQLPEESPQAEPEAQSQGWVEPPLPPGRPRILVLQRWRKNRSRSTKVPPTVLKEEPLLRHLAQDSAWPPGQMQEELPS
jgi:hypothetical protein